MLLVHGLDTVLNNSVFMIRVIGSGKRRSQHIESCVNRPVCNWLTFLLLSFDVQICDMTPASSLGFRAGFLIIVRQAQLMWTQQ
jgi:hypothetical protein